MREPKYRVWHKKEKRMYPNGKNLSLCFIGFNEVGSFNSVRLGEMDEGFNWTFQQIYGDGLEDIILDQYIGVDDCDGVEIYERDKVDYHDSDLDGDYEGIIAFDEEYNCFCLEADGSNFLKDYSNIKVVGNIHKDEV